ncbi:MAG TPA: FG-GAP-like repeat-containing protein [Chloroflexota bacterium]|nr:FG-GAP-like repeat-containing protein [Chloroflexota bacterium]HUM70639.1 FG-GAP-like repeat-containing protein [Chloroflexota bacterium]
MSCQKRVLIVCTTLCLSFSFLFLLLSLGKSTVHTIYAVSQTPPHITTIHPPANSHTTTLQTAVSANFDQPINPTTINSATFVVQGNQTGIITGVYAVQAGDVQLIPYGPFKPGELVRVSMTTGTQNFNGEGPVLPTVWQFWGQSPWGSGILTDSGQLLDVNRVTSVALGDLDGDGDLDVYLGTSDGISFNDPDEVWLNDGNGNFTDSGQRLGNSQSYAVLGDLDGDGDLDAFVANTEGNEVWFNQGDGSFVNSNQDVGDRGWDVDLGDLDGDGDLDAYVVPDSGNPNEIWLNNGDGTFEAGTTNMNNSAAQSVALGDLDGDGDLDAFVGTIGNTSHEVWINDGQAIFTMSSQSFGTLRGQDVALGDLDNDGDLDAFVCNGIEGGNQVFLNDGTGLFIDTQQDLGNLQSHEVDLGDLDGDNDLDAIIANAGDNVPTQIWINNGLGYFDEHQNLIDYNRLAIDLGDVDGDGDLDAFMGGFYPDAEVWINQDIPISGLIAINNSPSPLGIETTLTATFASGSPVEFYWDLGDDSTAVGDVVHHLYPAEGVYTAVVTASNSVNLMTTTTIITITPPIPITGLTATNSSPTTLGDPTFFTATILTGSNVSFLWEFDDGSSAQGNVVSHTYLADGNHTATVTATNGVSTLQTTTPVIISLPIRYLYLPVIYKPASD